MTSVLRQQRICMESDCMAPVPVPLEPVYTGNSVRSQGYKRLVVPVLYLNQRSDEAVVMLTLLSDIGGTQ